jgi:NAD(P)H-dependent FMN reductase
MKQPTGAIHVVIIKGRGRPRNSTGMAAALILDELKKHPKVSTEVIAPTTLSRSYCTRPPLTRQDASHPERRETDLQSKVAKNLQPNVGHATGAILATPEYYGSSGSLMKPVSRSLGDPSSLTGQAVAILGVASGPRPGRAPPRLSPAEAEGHASDHCYMSSTNTVMQSSED